MTKIANASISAIQPRELPAETPGTVEPQAPPAKPDNEGAAGTVAKPSRQSTVPPIKRWPADKVEHRSIESLLPYARNARQHSEEQVAQIAKSIQEWDWTNPVLIDEDGTIIARHGRVLAAKKLKITSIPGTSIVDTTETAAIRPRNSGPLLS